MKHRKDNLCKQCFKRPAKFSFQGKVKADKDHDLCMQCFRSNSDSVRAAITAQHDNEALLEMARIEEPLKASVASAKS